MDVWAIVNPVAGRRHVREELRTIARQLDPHAVKLRIQFTETPGDATRLAARIPETARAVLAVGGDGTVRQVIQGLLGKTVPLLILPAGTENIAAKQLGMTASPDQAVRRILDGVPRPLDVGLANGQCFMIVSGVGFDADVVHRLSATRRSHIGHADYFWPIWRTFATHRFPELEVEVDGAVVFRGRGLAFVGNLPRYSIGLRILERARPDDGLLDVCAYPCATRGRLMGHSLQTVLQRHVMSGCAIYAQGRRITVRSEVTARYQLDGDAGGCVPVCHEVVPNGVLVLNHM